MEPTSYTISIRDVKVVRVEEQFWRKYVSGVGKDAIFEEVSRGWWITLLGSRESLYAGHIKPGLEVGDYVNVRIEKCTRPVLSLSAVNTPSSP